MSLDTTTITRTYDNYRKFIEKDGWEAVKKRVIDGLFGSTTLEKLKKTPYKPEAIIDPISLCKATIMIESIIISEMFPNANKKFFLEYGDEGGDGHEMYQKDFYKSNVSFEKVKEVYENICNMWPNNNPYQWFLSYEEKYISYEKFKQLPINIRKDNGQLDWEWSFSYYSEYYSMDPNDESLIHRRDLNNEKIDFSGNLNQLTIWWIMYKDPYIYIERCQNEYPTLNLSGGYGLFS